LGKFAKLQSNLVPLDTKHNNSPLATSPAGQNDTNEQRDTKMTTTTYTTRGSVRGSCGHQHRTMAAALSCLQKDNRCCTARVGRGYSDRQIKAVEDGQERTLTNGEFGQAHWGWER
jgi:hypothetical protein